MFFTLSSYLCCFISFFSPLARWPWFCIGFSPLAPWLWFLLYFSFTTGSLAVAFVSDPLQKHFCGTLQFPGRLACTSNTTTQHCALRDRWLAVGARAPWSCSLQQRVLLTVRTGLRGRCRCGPSVFSNTTPTPLCASLGCVHPHNEGLHRGLLSRRGPSVRSAPLACHRSSCLSLSSDFFVTFARYFSSHVLITSSASQCHSHYGQMRLRVLNPDASHLHCTRERPTLLNCARSRLSAGCRSVFSFLFDTYRLLNEVSSLLVAVHSLSAECGRLC